MSREQQRRDDDAARCPAPNSNIGTTLSLTKIIGLGQEAVGLGRSQASGGGLELLLRPMLYRDGGTLLLLLATGQPQRWPRAASLTIL
jgi:hypothetical protein